MDAPTKRTRLEEPAAAAPATCAATASEHSQSRSQNKEAPPATLEKRDKKCKNKKKKVKAGFVLNDPTWAGCRCWLKHKGRYCKFSRFGGTFYCPHHLSEATGSATSTAGKGGSAAATAPSAAAKTIARRIPCPYDPSHDVYEHRLKKHLKKCPKYKEALAGASMPYYRKGYNSCSTTPTPTPTPTQNDNVQPHSAALTSAAGSVTKTTNAVREGNENTTAVVRTRGHEDGGAAADGGGGGDDDDGDDEAFMLRVAELYSKHVTPIENSFLTAEGKWLRQSRKAGAVDGHKKSGFKHEEQQSSILENMRAFGILPRSDLLDKSSVAKGLSQGHASAAASTSAPAPAPAPAAASTTTFVEFGAGRAKLSLALCTEVPGAHVLLIERAGGISMKADPKIREAHATCERLRVDIADLDLAAVPSLKMQRLPSCDVGGGTEGNQNASDPREIEEAAGSSKSVEPNGAATASITGISKHLCGPATDLAINCVCNFAESRLREGRKMGRGDGLKPPNAASCSSDNSPVRGVAFALCCHHRLTWDEYCGKEFFTKTLGLHPREFRRFVKATGWTTGYAKKSVAATTTTTTSLAEESATTTAEGAAALHHQVTGRKCKRLLDQGRLEYMRARGLLTNCKLVHYCDPAVSPENALLLAKP